jgi:hypothetical protein
MLRRFTPVLVACGLVASYASVAAATNGNAVNPGSSAA